MGCVHLRGGGGVRREREREGDVFISGRTSCVVMVQICQHQLFSDHFNTKESPHWLKRPPE